MKEPIGIRDYTIHGTELEPFHIYHQNYIHGGLQVPFHWHKEIEIIWVGEWIITTYSFVSSGISIVVPYGTLLGFLITFGLCFTMYGHIAFVP